jgi:phage gp45-like
MKALLLYISYTKVNTHTGGEPNSVIVTVDDDRFIPDRNTLSKDNAKIYFYRGHKIVFTKEIYIIFKLGKGSVGSSSSTYLRRCGVL